MYNVMKLGRCIVPKDHSLNFKEMIKEKKLAYVKSIGEVETHFLSEVLVCVCVRARFHILSIGSLNPCVYLRLTMIIYGK